MKKQFVITINDKGFILPYVLIIILITFICLTASVSFFYDEIYITQNHIEQLRIETLIQMAYTQFKEDFLFLEQEQEEVHYLFPGGDVKITYTILSDSAVNLYFFVQTKNNAIYTVTKSIPLKSDRNRTLSLYSF